MRKGLHELLISAPPRPSRQTFAALPDSKAVCTQLHASSTYVWPDVLTDDDVHPSPIALISAAGAMGKSEAARSIASELSSVYIDLAQMRVGSNSLSGEIFKAFGVEAGAEFIQALKAGSSTLVLDSADEAQLAAGRGHFLAFLDDLAWLLLDAAPMHQVVVLGRPDAMILTYLALVDLGIEAPVLELAPLSHDQATDLINLALDHRVRESARYDRHRTHSVPFSELREAVFQNIAAALEPNIESEFNWASVERFLGYPPVLLALAERLAVENPALEISNLRSSSIARRLERGELLQVIVEHILDRESQKVRERMGNRLGMREDDPERRLLYSRDEQVVRLLGMTGTRGVDVSLPEGLNATDKATYEEHIDSFLIDHPFIHNSKFANVVFSDYVRSWAVTSPLSPFYGNARVDFLGTLPTVGPFFSDFMYALSTSRPAVMPEGLVSDAITSHQLGSATAGAVYLHGDSTARLALYYDEPVDGTDERILNFDVSEVSGVLELRAPIARLTCISEHAVLLRSSTGELEIGPEVGIVADTIVFTGRALSVLGGTPENKRWSFFSAHEVEHDAALQVSAYPDDSLSISWKDPWPQWKPFANLTDVQESQSLPWNVRPQILLGLRRILSSFRGSMTDTPSVSADKVDRIVVGANPIFAGVLDALVELAVVERSGNLYRLLLTELGKYEISWATLRGNDPSRSLSALARAVVEVHDFATK